MAASRLEQPDPPWVMRTYSGHSNATASNRLYRSNLAKGQTGLSVAFDLPTQTGYDPDAPEARGEVGKVGVPVAHLGHMAELMEGLPLERMNTSMTINATAAWLLGLYAAHADQTGAAHHLLAGTTQNDIVKEYLARGTYIFPPDASKRLTVDLIAWAVRNMPRWNPINVCSYHLQEAGATPVQEIAFALASAMAVVDAVRDSGQVEAPELPAVVGRISFFCNSGMRFVEEACKMRAFTAMWDRICLERWNVDDPALRRFRYGVQVNSLGLTEQQPENNVARIAYEALGVTLSRSARARAIQLPAWNEALGLPRPWDQQWSLRIQQLLAYETDLLEYPDLLDGSHVVEQRTAELIDAASSELDRIEGAGGAFECIGQMKAALVASNSDRAKRIESGELPVVGVNRFATGEPSPLAADGAILRVDPVGEEELAADVARWRSGREGGAVIKAIDALRRAAEDGENVMSATIRLAVAGGTTGEWAGALREVWGEYRAPTGIGSANSGRAGGVRPSLERARAVVATVRSTRGAPPRILVAKPGLDGHSSGAEQIALAARDSGFEVIYQGIRQTPQQIVATARDEDVDLLGLSVLSGSHLELVAAVLLGLETADVKVPVVVGGIIPPDDAERLKEMGVAAVYTPRDYEIGRVMAELAELVAASA